MAKKNTTQPSKKKGPRTHGFRARSASSSGKKVIKRRRLKNRVRLTP